MKRPRTNREQLDQRNRNRAETAVISARRSRAALELNKLPTSKPLEERINTALTTADEKVR